MLKITLIGYIGKDAENVQSNGKNFLRFPVAVDEISKNNEKKTRWLTCYTSQEKLADYLKKGKQVFVEGNHKIVFNTGQDGQTYVSEAINVVNLQLLGKKDKDDNDLPIG